MPLCDWTKVNAGLFHHFHQRWIGEITDSLNAGRLPADLFALVEQFAGGMYPDALTLERGPRRDNTSGGIALLDTPPRTRFQMKAEMEGYAARANKIVIRHVLGDVVAAIEIVSPGNKSSQIAFRDFIDKTVHYIRNGVHVLVIDLFPPTQRDPQGVHKEIWNQFDDAFFELPADKPLTLASYAAGDTKEAFVEPVAVGDALPDMPLFVQSSQYILVPLEATYQETWRKCPEPYRQAVMEAQKA